MVITIGGGGGGGAGGAGGRGSGGPNNRTCRRNSILGTDGLGGGLQVPTTFRDPKAIYDGVHSWFSVVSGGGGGGGGLFNPCTKS